MTAAAAWAPAVTNELGTGLEAWVLAAAEVALLCVLVRVAAAAAAALAARALERRRPGSPRAATLRVAAVRLGPRLARGALAGLAGAGLVAAVPAAGHAGQAGPAVPTLDRVVATSGSFLDHGLTGGTVGWRDDGRRHRVRPGDTLWSVARDALDDDVTAAQVDRSWRRWYATNRDVVGPDPGVLRPGVVLDPPSSRTASDRDAR